MSAGVRRSDDADPAAIQHIYAHYVAHTPASFEETPPEAAELARRRDAVIAGVLPHLVAEREDEIAGHASPFRTRTSYRYTLEDSVYVAPGLERRGVATALVAAVIETCTALGDRQMVAIIGDGANDASIRFHARTGFREAGLLRAVGFEFGRWIDAVLMQRALGPGHGAPPGVTAYTDAYS